MLPKQPEISGCIGESLSGWGGANRSVRNGRFCAGLRCFGGKRKNNRIIHVFCGYFPVFSDYFAKSRYCAPRVIDAQNVVSAYFRISIPSSPTTGSGSLFFATAAFAPMKASTKSAAPAKLFNGLPRRGILPTKSTAILSRNRMQA